MAIDRQHHPLGRQTQFLGRCIDDSLIRLMRHDPIDITGHKALIGEHITQNISQIGDRVTKDLTALHPDVADRLGARWAAIDIEQFVVRSVSTK